MRIIEVKRVFRCEHCNKLFQSQTTCAYHEKRCNKTVSKLNISEDIEAKFPHESGQHVIMEIDMSYNDVRQANYYRKQGAKWLLDLLKDSQLIEL